MNELTAKTELAMLAAQNERLLGFLQTASAQLRGSEDAEGIESLLSALSELEKLVENDQNSPQSQIDLDRLLPAVRTLHFYVQNQDITGIADLLKDTFYPLAEHWLRGCDDL